MKFFKKAKKTEIIKTESEKMYEVYYYIGNRPELIHEVVTEKEYNSLRSEWLYVDIVEAGEV